MTALDAINIYMTYLKISILCLILQTISILMALLCVTRCNLHLKVETLAEQQLVVQVTKRKFPTSGGLFLPFGKFIALFSIALGQLLTLSKIVSLVRCMQQIDTKTLSKSSFAKLTANWQICPLSLNLHHEKIGH